MSLSHHQQNQLHLIEAGLLRSEPQLAARLSLFGRLFAGEAMPAWEQVSSRHDRIRQAAALIAETISVAAAALLLFKAVLTLVAAVVPGVRGRPGPTGSWTRTAHRTGIGHESAPRPSKDLRSHPLGRRSGRG